MHCLLVQTYALFLLRGGSIEPAKQHNHRLLSVDALDNVAHSRQQDRVLLVCRAYSLYRLCGGAHDNPRLAPRLTAAALGFALATACAVQVPRVLGEHAVEQEGAASEQRELSEASKGIAGRVAQQLSSWRAQHRHGRGLHEVWAVAADTIRTAAKPWAFEAKD